jgi:hypothetical protein
MRLNDVILKEETGSTRVIVNKELNALLWDGDKLKPNVRDALLKIADHFEKFIGVDLPVVDYTITGSSANYSWTQFSDLDLHLVVRGDVSEEARELYSAKKTLWGEQHDITVKGIPVECYVQGLNEPHHSTGVYSIVRKKWLVTPQKKKPKVDDVAVIKKREALLHDVHTALLNPSLDKLNAIKEKITTMRRAGLERAGEWSTENLVFKDLRNLGVIEQLTKKIREMEDQDLSLEQAKHLY